MHQFPLWATPERRACLALMVAEKLPSLTSTLFDLLTDVMLGGESLAHLADNLTDTVCYDQVEYWKADDREGRSYLWKLEKRRLHRQFQIKKRGPFDSIRREQYLADRPIWRIEAIGVSAFTQRRVAKIAIPELRATLWVDIGGIPLKVGKHKFRKLARRGGSVPKEIVDQIENRCSQAVQRFLAN